MGSRPSPRSNPVTAPYAAVLAMPFGPVGLRLAGDALSGIDFLPPDTATVPPDDPLAVRVSEALRAYLADSRQPFADLPLRPAGTPFQRRVWHALRQLPAGQTITYGALAARLGSGARAVGNACRANPLPLVVPCHRVVAAGGLGGFAGDRAGGHTAIKAWLLRHEGALP